MQALFSCPHCGFSFRPRASFLVVDYCPRCLVRRHVAEPLRAIEESKPLPPAANDGERDGWCLSLIDGPAPVRRIFALTGTDGALPFTSMAKLAGANGRSPAEKTNTSEGSRTSESADDAGSATQRQCVGRHRAGAVPGRTTAPVAQKGC